MPIPDKERNGQQFRMYMQHPQELPEIAAIFPPEIYKIILLVMLILVAI